MTEGKGAAWGEESVRISSPKMRELYFTYEGPDQVPDGTQISYEWGLHLFRFSRLTLGVEFTVIIEMSGLVGRTTYRIGFEIADGSAEAAEPERAMRILAARVAPVTLFPYVREAFGSAAMRSGLHFHLPFQNVGALFSPEDIQIPDVPTDEGGGEDAVSNPVTNAAGEG